MRRWAAFRDSRRCERVLCALFGFLRSISTMMSNLCDEEQLRELVPITTRQLRTLRLTGRIPFIKVNRRMFLYSPERVLAALAELEIKTKGSATKE